MYNLLFNVRFRLAQNAVTRIQTSATSTKNLLQSHSKVEYPSYFVLVILTRGVFNDLKETVQSIIFASRAPLSIIFAAIGDELNSSNEISTTEINCNHNLSSMINGETSNTISTEQNNQSQPVVGELERMAVAGTRLNYHGRKPERDCVQVNKL